MQSLVFKPQPSASALVVGDIILDRYVHGETSRISPEAPVPIVRVVRSEDRPGGAANVAQNLCAVGIKVRLTGITGDDEFANILSEQLMALGVDCQFSRQSNFSTIAKMRVISQHQQLLRLDYEENPHAADTSGLLDAYRRNVADSDVVILSDYAKGSLGNVQEFIKIAQQAGVPVFIDPKGDDFTRYAGASVITPNQRELEGVVGICKDLDELIHRAEGLKRQLSIDAMLITRGRDGMMLMQNDKEPLHFKAQAHEIFDVTGAGDTVIAVLAAAFISGYSFEQAVAFSNIAAGVVVEKLGAATASVDEINRAGQRDKQITSLDMLCGQLEVLKKEKKIVMTNGCFDVLHAGHVSYLSRARELGDYLLVAVNDDQSVQRLKGNSRPVIPLKQRMAVLAALECVDGVIAFSEDTPQKIIERVSPDVLVKGGNYTESEIVGAEFVRETGGRVVVVPLEENCSTTAIIEKIINQEVKL